MTNPLKTIQIEGFLADDVLKCRLSFEYCGLNEGNWEIAICDFMYFSEISLTNNFIITIKSNLVVGYTFSSIGALSFDKVTLVNTLISSASKTGLVYFPLKWFTINNINETIMLYLNKWPSSHNIIKPANFKVSVTMLLRRVN